MKWFLIQSVFLALAAFGLGALFHRLLWKKPSGVSPTPTAPVTGSVSSGEVMARKVTDDAVAARAAELAALRAERDKVVAERDSKTKEFAALSFEHAAAKTGLSDRDESVASLQAQLDAAATSLSAASAETEGLLEQVESHTRTIDDRQSQLAAANADNDAALAALRIDYEGRQTVLTSEHDRALGEMRDDYEGRLAVRASDHDAVLSVMGAEHDRALQDAHGDRDRTLSGLRGDHERALAELRRRAESAEDELARVRAEYEGCAADLSGLRRDLETKHSEVQGLVMNLEAAKLRAVDDLEAIEGIGPVMANALHADGIRTYDALASADEGRLRSAIEKAGQRFAPSMTTWARQAAYLAAGDQDGFATYTDYLIAGVDPAGLTDKAGNDGHFGSSEVTSFVGTVDPGSDEAFEGDDVVGDDLLRVEGIGPKISEILVDGGIRSFRRLAAVPEERVRSIVDAGGVSFIPSIATWAAQAALLRDGDEAGFQALVDRLVAGRDDAR